jgi:DNA-binding MarR family transcriptional regulator
MMLVVDDLEQRGYVRRVPDAEDARAKVVRLTARGRRYVAEARRAMAALETSVRRELGEHDAQARRGLRVLRREGDADVRRGPARGRTSPQQKKASRFGRPS